MDVIEDEAPDLEEQIFHNNVREQVIFMLFFILLYLVSFTLIKRFKRKGREDYYSTDEDEIMVYRISTWLCTFSLAVSIGAVLLLPFSIISNEVLILYPKSYYVQWLNSSLVQGLWNYVFLFSNISLFMCLPFAYLFIESEGFFGHRKGLMARIQETVIVLALLALAVFGLTYVIYALVHKDETSIQTLLNLWTYHLPFLYSCISFLGVLMLLVCTPLGFVRLFDVAGRYLIKPHILHDIDEEYHAYALEEECLRRRLKQYQTTGRIYAGPAPMSIRQRKSTTDDDIYKLTNGQLQFALGMKLSEVETKRKLLDKQRQTSSFRRNFFYPVAVILLIGLTAITVCMVLQNTVELLIGIKALPLSSRQFTLGITSLSTLGPIGAFLEIILILYLIATSSIGLYSSPPMSWIRPRAKSTPFSLIIGNCALILILSSALPLLSKILGITNFDLLGDFGSIEWLGNFKIVFMYNLVFATATTVCIANNFTVKVRRELYARLVENYMMLSNYVSFLN
ncbi:hypothetical protein FQA39_LY01571 [Lamprigera yunnana]|nr:hypothetical protein FQA39_LY01571 [Lamprigera yunnana]